MTIYTKETTGYEPWYRMSFLSSKRLKALGFPQPIMTHNADDGIMLKTPFFSTDKKCLRKNMHEEVYRYYDEHDNTPYYAPTELEMTYYAPLIYEVKQWLEEQFDIYISLVPQGGSEAGMVYIPKINCFGEIECNKQFIDTNWQFGSEQRCLEQILDYIIDELYFKKDEIIEYIKENDIYYHNEIKLSNNQ